VPLGYRLRDEFCCPITRELMCDPVIASDGHTYDRAAIERWLRSHQTSPKTAEVMQSLDLIPNHNLKRLVGDMLKEGGAGLYCRDEDYDPEKHPPGGPQSRVALVREPALKFSCLGPAESSWNGRSFRAGTGGVVGGRRRPEGGGEFVQVRVGSRAKTGSSGAKRAGGLGEERRFEEAEQPGRARDQGERETRPTERPG
jgi:hypothetical protein